MPNQNEDKKKSIIEKMRELDAADKRAELEEESKQAQDRAKLEEQKRRAYEEKLCREKLELMKLKAGVISESDLPPQETAPQKEYTLWEKISNFFYHNKAAVILSCLFGALAVFLIYDYVTTVRPDIQALYIAPDYDMSFYADTAGEVLSPYGQDYNKDGGSVVKVYYVPAGYANDAAASAYLAQSDRTKLLGEFQSGNTIIIIGTKESYESLGAMEDVFADCRELFPGDEYAEEIGYRLAGTDFKTLIDRPDMKDSELYVSFRKPVKTMGMSAEKMKENYDKAVLFWQSFITDHRVDGITLPEIPDPEHIPTYDEMNEQSMTEAEAAGEAGE